MIAALLLLAAPDGVRAYLAKADAYGPMVDAETGIACPVPARGRPVWETESYPEGLPVWDTPVDVIHRCMEQRETIIRVQRRKR